jgi:hypothetical protein
MFGTGLNDALQHWRCFLGATLTEEALAEVGLKIDVGAVALDGGAIAGFCFLELALLEIYVAEFGVMMGFIQMMNLALEFLDAIAIISAGEFEAGGGAGLNAVNEEEIEDRTDAGKDEHKSGPDVFLAADGVHNHPDGKENDQQNPWVPQKVLVQEV